MATRRKPTTSVDDMPIEQALCRSLTGHQWNWAAHRADKVGRNFVVYMPCSQCRKVTSILIDKRGVQLRGRYYVDPAGWINDKYLNTVAGRAAMRARLIPMLHEEESS